MKRKFLLTIIMSSFCYTLVQAKNSWENKATKYIDQGLEILNRAENAPLDTYCSSLKEALPYYEKAADLGSIQGNYVAGVIYANGVVRCKWPATGKGSQYLFKACQSQYADSCNKLQRYGIGY